MKDLVAVVTGAGRGIGKAIAETLAAEGAIVVLTARTEHEIENVRHGILAAGGRAAGIVCDVTKSQEIDSLSYRVRAELGPVSILVNNAGVAPSAKFTDTSDAMLHDTVAVNLNGPFFACRAFMPQLLESEKGQIVNVASVAGLRGFPYTAAYTASKHALIGLTRALAVEYAKTALQINAVCPGFVRTAILEESMTRLTARGVDADDAEARFAAMNDEGRIIEPSEVARAVMLLLRSDLKGKCIDVAGTVVD